MKIQGYHWLFPLFLLSLGHAMYGWGGLTLIDDLGPVAEHSAEREGALTWTYMQGGRWIIERAGWREAAKHQAEVTFAPARERLLATPAIAMDLLHGPPLGVAHRLLQWTHWLTPLLLLLASVSYVRRQKPVMTTRRIR